MCTLMTNFPINYLRKRTNKIELNNTIINYSIITMAGNKGNKVSCTYLTQDGTRIMAYIIKKRKDTDQYYIRLPKPSILILENNYIKEFDWTWYQCCVHRPGPIQLNKNELTESGKNQYKKAIVQSKEAKCYICFSEKEVDQWPCTSCRASDPIKTIIGKIMRKPCDSYNKHTARCAKPRCIDKIGLPKSRSRGIYINNPLQWAIASDLEYRKFCAEPAIRKMIQLLILRENDRKFGQVSKRIIGIINKYIRRYY